MPILEYQCPVGHVTEKIFLTFGAVTETLPCAQCEYIASKIPSVPFQGHFFGNPSGYHKPSPRKRFSNKLVSARDGNKTSIG